MNISRIFMIFALLILFGCANSPLNTGVRADNNRIQMLDIKKGMDEQEVMCIMGCPYKVETYRIDNQDYEVWFYITSALNLGQTRFIDQNFTPIIFKDETLWGWGHNHYRYLLNIYNARKRNKEVTIPKYTNDKEEWPGNKHKIIEHAQPQTKVKESLVPEEKPMDDDKALERIIEEKKESLLEKSKNFPKTEEDLSSRADDQPSKLEELKESVQKEKTPLQESEAKETEQSEELKQPVHQEEKTLIKPEDKSQEEPPRCKQGTSEDADNNYNWLE